MQSETLDPAAPASAPAAPALRDPRELATGLQVAVVAESALWTAVVATGGRTGPPAWAAPLVTALTLIALVLVACWLRRCRLNGEVLAPGTLRYGPGLAAGAWFIPLAMWWIPARIVLDVRRASGLDGRAWLLAGWWSTHLARTALWLGMTFAGAAGADVTDAVTAPLGVVSGVLMILTVREITAAQAKHLAG
ncbi:DUF4328 domain-containing protein [Kitasatospora sp. NPDC047058]|uniref:DUF4328 domain-containing protein n=1 Tax=Kitasatospora sp. NPDC047058 TaxID=3155620 RepID=UPI0033F73B04